MAMSFRKYWRSWFSDLFRVPPRTPGTLGLNDQADPNRTSCMGDTPGILGLNDFADPSSGFFQRGSLPRVGVPFRASDGAILSPELMCRESVGEPAVSSPSAGQVEVAAAQEMALKISTFFEGGKSMNYKALAGDFDHQGTSFGLIQWNFGQNTLGPLLKKMLLKDLEQFAKCFGPQADYETLKKALTDDKKDAQMKWARDLIRSHRSAWTAAFHAIGSVIAFNRIQLEQAITKYHPLAVAAIASLRSLNADLMKAVEFRTYAALFDLCVQQNGLTKAWDSIKRRVKDEKPATQLALVTIAVVERGKKASHAWVSDCISRRLGILSGSVYESKEHSVVQKRANPEFSLIAESGTKSVVGL